MPSNDDDHFHKTSQNESGGGSAIKWLIVLAILAGIATAFYFYAIKPTVAGTGQQNGHGGRHGGGFGAPAPLVVTAMATTQDVDIYLPNCLGTVTPLATVTVNSQVTGQLMKVPFVEGQMVKKGELLAEIDERPFQAQLLQTQGALLRDQALLKDAQLNLQRYQTLVKQKAVTAQTFTTQQALVAQYEGNIKSDQGAIDTAKLQIQYSKITSPVNGRISLRMVDPGNIVQANSSAGIATITELQPMNIVFSTAENYLPEVRKQVSTGAKLKVEAYDSWGTNKIAEGTLASIDNSIDPSTGQVKLKALFTNDDLTLYPGQFVNIHLLLTVHKNAVVAPTVAVQIGTSGSYVYAVQKDDTVKVQPVKTGVEQGTMTEITSGLSAGDAVVTQGVDRLRDGMKVKIYDPTQKSSAEKTGSSAGKTRSKHRSKS